MKKKAPGPKGSGARRAQAAPPNALDKVATIAALLELEKPLAAELRVQIAQFLAGVIGAKARAGPMRLNAYQLGLLLPLGGTVSRATIKRLHVAMAAQDAKAAHATGMPWDKAIAAQVALHNEQWASFVGFTISAGAISSLIFPRKRRKVA